MTAPVTLRLGRNLTSLEYTSDPTDRATQLAPIAAEHAGAPTFLGQARFRVTSVNPGTKTLVQEDPGAGAGGGAIAFDHQFSTPTASYIWREKTGETALISDTSASAQSITLVAWISGLAAGEYVQFRTALGTPVTFAVGMSGPLLPVSQPWLLPAFVTAIDTSTKTLTVVGPSGFDDPVPHDGSWVGFSALFSTYVATPAILSTVSPAGLIVAQTLQLDDVTGIAVDDWGYMCYTPPAPGSQPNGPAVTVTAVDAGLNQITVIRRHGDGVYYGIVTGDIVIFRPATASTVTDSVRTGTAAGTITVASVSGWSVAGGRGAIELSGSRVVGTIPYYLDHPVYAQPTFPGIGPKFKTLDRSQIIGVPVVNPNPLLRAWADPTALPDGYTWSTLDSGLATDPATGTALTTSQNTDPLFQKLSPNSLFFSATQGRIITPPRAWAPTYPGERFSGRWKVYLTQFDNPASIIQVTLGLKLADGTVKQWNDRIGLWVPPASPRAGNPQKAGTNAFVDLGLDGSDVTVPSTAPGGVTQQDIDSIGTAAVLGFIFCLYLGPSNERIEGYLDAVNLVPSLESPSEMTEFGGSNFLWQETQTGLRLLAPLQWSGAVSAVDLFRMNPSLNPDDEFYTGRAALLDCVPLGLANQLTRIVEDTRNEQKKGERTILLQSRQRKLADFFTKSGGSKGGGTTGASSGSTASSGGTPTPPSGGGGGGTSKPSITLDGSIASDIPTATALVSPGTIEVRFAGSTSSFPDEATTAAGTSDTTPPFANTFGAISPGQTLYVSAFAYDLNGVRSDIAQIVIADSLIVTPGVGVLSLAGFAPTATNGAHSTVTIDHTKCGSADTADFPMLFSETIAALKTVANGGSVVNANHVRFATDALGVTLLNWEMIKQDVTTGELVAFVKIPTLSHTSDTVIYLLYDDNGITTFQGGSTGTAYDTDYKTVINGGDGTTLDLADHTTNANDGTNHGGAVAIAGPNGLGAISFAAGSSQYITTPNTLNIGHPTIETLLYMPSNPGSLAQIAGFTQGNGSPTADKDLMMGADGHLRWYVYNGAQQFMSASSLFATGTWGHAMATHDGTNINIYSNGVLTAQLASGSSFTGYTLPGFQINGFQTAGGSASSTYFTCRTSVTRLSDIARSASYALATSNNLLSPSTFYTVT